VGAAENNNRFQVSSYISAIETLFQMLVQKQLVLPIESSIQQVTD
jgi:hypothetical protein